MAHGIFISYRHENRHLAGRIYDFLKDRGLDPFMDDYDIKEEAWTEALKREIDDAPYFLCLLTEADKDYLEGLVGVDIENSKSTEYVFYKEIAEAFKDKSKGNKTVLIIAYGFDYKSNNAFPDEIRELNSTQATHFSEDNGLFFSSMNNLVNDRINIDQIISLNWKNYLAHQKNASIFQRKLIEDRFLAANYVYGEQLVENAFNCEEPYEGNERITNERIKQINIACYTANLLFKPERNIIDDRAHDNKATMYHVLSYLLNDEQDFTLNIVTTAPQSIGSKDATKYSKLANSRVKGKEEYAFLRSYATLYNLMYDPKTKSEHAFSTALDQDRLRCHVTECALPYAIFNVVFKDEWSHLNYVKVDLYSLGLKSNTQRRSMVFFESIEEHRENYEFFTNQFDEIFDSSISIKDIQKSQKHAKWMKEYEKLQGC